MKRKRQSETADASSEPTRAKRQKPQTKTLNTDSTGNYSKKATLPRLSALKPKRKSNKPDQSVNPIEKKKTNKPLKNDLNENREGADDSLMWRGGVGKKNKNGLQTNSTSKLPSEHNMESGDDAHPFKKAFNIQAQKASEESNPNVGTQNKKNKKKVQSVTYTADSLDHNIDYKEEIPEKPKTLHEILFDGELLKKPKKKVRIDETESLKVKKEMAGSESHFSTKELPAKIIKSKSNKNLTEDVKVSPLTIEEVKLEKRSPPKDEMGTSTWESHSGKKKCHFSGISNYGTSSDSSDFEGGDLTNSSKSARKKTSKTAIQQDELDIKEETEFQRGSSDESRDGMSCPIKEEPDYGSSMSDIEDYLLHKSSKDKTQEKNKKKEPSKNPRKSVLMPKEDQFVLVKRIEEVIPEGDSKNYRHRVRSLDWQNISFKNYTLDECKTVWERLLKKVRHYRILSEITHDVRKIIEDIDLNAISSQKTKSHKFKHPDMPKRPLSAYFLYYLRNKDKISKEKPQLDTMELTKYISEVYQKLPASKKQKYEALSIKQRELYKVKMEEFYDRHPELRKAVGTKKGRPPSTKEKPPKRPENAYKLFVSAESNREEISEEDKAEFKEVCREKWRQMSGEKKLYWIKLAEELHSKYEEELKNYMARNPEYTPKKVSAKPVLTRQEMELKDKLAGKPKKPPSTAYSLFISMTLQSSETAAIPHKEKWNYTSTKWKAMSEEEREQYRQLLIQVQEQYQADFQAYLERLPEDKRQEEIVKNLPKKRKNATAVTPKPSTSTVVPKRSPRGRNKQQTTSSKSKVENPLPPPRSTFKYFAEKTGGNKEAWKSLTAADRKKYEQELTEIKEKYIKDFEKYLKSLNKDQLAAFCAMKQEEYAGSPEETDSSGSDCDGEESSNDGDSDSSE